MKKSDIAIVVFTYGRLEHTKITLEALSANKYFDEYSLIIYSDGPKIGHEEKVELVREYIRDFCKKHQNTKVIEREKNLGLERSIIIGISEILKKYLAVIVVEDDIRTSTAFLEYMKKMLELYEKEEKVGCISGYNQPLMKLPDTYVYDIYFAPRTCSWGWATWRDRWENVDWKISDIDEFINDKEKQRKFNEGGSDLTRMLVNQVKKGIDTWDIQWCYHNFKNNKFTIYPKVSYVENIGMDGSGIHCGKTSGFKNENLNNQLEIKTPNMVSGDKDLLKIFKKAQGLTPKMYLELIIDRILKIIRKFISK